MVYIAVILFFNLYPSHAQEAICPIPPENPEHPCVTVTNWNDFVSTVKSSRVSDSLIFCRFNIDKPPSASALMISKPVTLVCLEESQCIINAMTSGNKGIVKMNGLAKVSMHGFLFRSNGASFNKSSAIHVTFGTKMKQVFCNCSFNE